MNDDMMDATEEAVEGGQLNFRSPEVIFVLPPICGCDGQVQYGAVLVEQDFPGAVAYAPLGSSLQTYSSSCDVLAFLSRTAVDLEGLAQQLESRVPGDRAETLQRQVVGLRMQKRRLMASRPIPDVADGSVSGTVGESE